MGAGNPVLDMSRETFLTLMDWLKKTPYRGNVVHLMGGEPTLHKDFACMAKTIKERGVELAVFSNAATPHAPDYAEQLQHLNIRWIVNVNPPESRTPQQEKYLRESLNILGDNVTLTFNMTPEPVPNEWLFDLIFGYKLRKKIKVGFVLPTLSHTNQHLHQEDYSKVAGRVVEFASRCETFGVTLEYECGIPWCVFTPHQLGQLWHYNSKFFSSCNSILDILPDGQIVYCLPLVTLHAVPFEQFEHYPAAKAWFESTFAPYRPLGSTAGCFSCNLMRSGVCRGGCLARILYGAHNIKSGDAGEREKISSS
jgi:radical SAM protein with 4Fe4S-binding SPASM domain